MSLEVMRLCLCSGIRSARRALGLALLLLLPRILCADAPWPSGGAWPVYGTQPAGMTPVAWPANGAWATYTSRGSSLTDPATSDPSNGGTSPQSYVNVSSGCTDKTQPSVYWAYNSVTKRMFFRFRLAAQPNTYATGPSAGSAATTDPWKSAIWSVLIDTNGDGYRDFAVQLNGSTGGPGTPVDRVSIIWSANKAQSLDYLSTAGIYLVNQFPAAFVDAPGGRILNFHSTNSPDTSWPNGSSETVWDYGMTRCSAVPGSGCTEYFLDFQVPLAMLDARSVGGPLVTETTPVSFLFATSNSLNNPFQKDVVTSGDYAYIADPNAPAPFGDVLTATGTTIPQPIVSSISASGCGPATLTAQVADAQTFVGGVAVTTVASVQFYFYADLNGDGVANDGSSWTLIGSGSTSSGALGKWTATWNTSSLANGRYLIGAVATDTEGNITTSWLDPGAPPAPPNYTNPPTVGAVTVPFTNTCGLPPPYATKSSDATGPVSAGATVNFTVTVFNTNASAVTVSSITDTLPSGFTYTTAGLGGSLGAPSGGPANGATGTLTWTFSAVSIPASSSRTFIFRTTAPASAGTYSNLASVVTSAGTLATGSASVSVGSPKLSLLKTVSANSANPGDAVTYTLAYSNDSPVNVTGAVLSDVLPTGTTFVSASGGGSYTSGTRTVAWALGSLPAGASGSVTVTATVDSPFPTGAAIPVSNTATLTSTEASTVTASASLYVTASRPVLSVQKSTSPATVAANSNVVFTISYANTGNATATGLTLTDPIPAGLTFVSATGGGTNSGGTVTWNLPNLAADATGSVTVTLNVPSGYSGANPLVNTVTLAASGVSSVSNSFWLGVNQTGTVCSTYYFYATTANVGFDGTQKVATTAVPGGAGTNTQVVTPTNQTYVEAVRFYTDPAVANAVNLSGNLTTSFYLDRANGGGITIQTQLYDYDSTTGSKIQLGSTATQSFTGSTKGALTPFTVPLSGTLQKGHRLLWIYSVKSNTNGSDTVYLQYGGTVTNPISGGTTNANANANYCVTPPANLIIDKQVDKLTAAPGDTLTYTILFSNTGQTNATGAQIADTLPAGVTFASATLNGPSASAASVSGQVYTFNVRSSDTATSGQVTGGQSGTLVITATVNSPLASGITSLSNLASLVSSETSAITDTAATTVLRPSVTVAKSADRTLVGPGEIVTYTLTALNGGTGTATNVTLTDALPVQAYFAYVAGSTRVNGATVADSVSGGTLTYNLGSLAPGASATLAFQMQGGASGTFPATQTTLSNTATVSDAQTSGTRSSNAVSITINPLPNLRLTEAISPSGTRSPGDTLTVTLTVANDGGASASSVLAYGTVPSYAAFVPGSMTLGGAPLTDGSGDDAGTYDAVNNRTQFSLGSLAAGATQTLTYRILLQNPMPSGSTVVTPTSQAVAANAASKSASASATVSASAVLSLAKLGPSTSPYPGSVVSAASTGASLQVSDPSAFSVNQYVLVSGQIRQITAISGSTLTLSSAATVAQNAPVIGSLTYTLQYANSGTSDSASATLVDTLPGGAVYAASTGSGVYASGPGTVTWSLGALAAGSSGSVNVTFFPGSAGNAVDNASLSASGATTATASFTTGVGGLRPAKSTSTPTVVQTASGAVASYDITIQNTSAATATGVVVTDTLPSGFTYKDTTAVTGGTVTSSPTLGDQAPAWGTFSIPASGTLQITFRADIAAGVGGQTYSNDLSASSSGGTPVGTFDPLLNTAANVTVSLSPGLTDGLSAPATAASGTGFDYTAAYGNQGTSAATGTAAVLTLPSGVTFVSATGGGSYAAGSRTVTWSLGSLAAGASGSQTVHVTVDSPMANGTVLTASLSLSCNETGPASASASTTATSAPVMAAGLSAPGSASAGASLTYTASYGNTGTTTATGTSVVLTLPAGYAFASASGGGVYSAGAGTVTWAIGALASGGSGSFTVTGATPSPVANGTVLSASLAVSCNEAGTATATANTTLASAPVLAVSKTAGAGTVGPGQNIVYTLHYSNTGTDQATHVSLSDTLPVNTTFVAASDGGTNTAGVAGWSLGTVAAGASGTVTLTVKAGGGLSNGTLISNTTYSVASDQTSAAAGGAVDVTVSSLPALAATLAAALGTDADASGNVTPGDTLTYTAVVSNPGGSSASNAVFQCTPGTHLSLVSGSVTSTAGTVATGNAGGDTSVRINIPSLAAGGSATITFQALIGTPLAAGVASVSTQGSLGADTLSAILTDDPGTVASADATVTPLSGGPVITAEKSVSVDGGGNLVPGGTLTYTIRLQNSGPYSVSNAEFRDTLPANTSYVASSLSVPAGSTVATESPVDVTGISLPGNSVALLTFRVRVPSAVPAGLVQISNQGTLLYDPSGSGSNGTTLPTDGNTPGQPTVIALTAGPNFDTSVKTVALVTDADASGGASPGDTLRYTVTLPNTGDQDAAGVQFEDPLPSQVAFKTGTLTASAGTAAYDGTARKITWSGDVAAGASVQLVFDVQVNAAAAPGATVSNQGTVSFNATGSGSPDRSVLTDADLATPGKQAATFVLGSAPAPVVTMTVVDATNGHAAADPGDTLTYTVTFQNASGYTLAGGAFTDLIPGRTSYVPSSATLPAGATLISTSPFQVSGLSIPAGGQVSLSFQVLVDSSIPPGVTSILNQGTLTYDGAGVGSNADSALTDGDALTAGAQPTSMPLTAPPSGSLGGSASISAGCSATLSWTASGATSGGIDHGGGSLPVANGSGTVVVSPASTTTYTLTLTGPGGVTTYTATVTVNPAPSISAFTAAPSTIAAGAPVTFSATFSGGTGLITPGNLLVTSGVDLLLDPGPGASTTYTLTVTAPCGAASQATSQTTVAVGNVPAGSLSGGTAISAGCSATLNWTAANATGGSIDHGVGSLPVANGSGSVVVSPGTTTTYTLTLNGPGGTSTFSATVTVNPAPSIFAFSASPAQISAGASVTFNASFSGGTGVLSPGGQVLSSGVPFILNPGPSTTTTYSLVVTAPCGSASQATSTALVTVSGAPGAPTGSLSAGGAISSGCSTALGWTAADATSGVLNPGNVAVDVSAGSGSIPVSPAATTTYTLTLTGPGGSTDHSAQVVVNPAPTIAAFSATPGGIGAGQAVTFSATFSGGSGLIQPGSFPIVSGGTYVLSSGPDSTTAYTLTVTAPCGSASQATATSTVTVGALASDLRALKAATDVNGGNLLPGDEILYTMVFQNLGNTPVVGADYTDPIPAHTSYVAGSLISPGGTALTAVSPALRIRGLDIPAHGQVGVAFRVKVDLPLASGVTQIVSQGALGFDSNGDGTNDAQLLTDGDTVVPGDQATVLALRAGPNLDGATLTVALAGDVDADGLVSPGDRLRYRTVIQNRGDQDSSGATYRWPVPAHTDHVAGSDSASSGSIRFDASGQAVLWAGDIPAGGTVILLSDAVVQSGISPGLVLSSQGTVAYDPAGAGTNDTLVLTDGDTALPGQQPTVIPVGNVPRLSATEMVAPVNGGAVGPGDELRYDIVINNPSGFLMPGVEFVDALPANTTYVPGSLVVPAGATVLSEVPTLRVSNLTLPPGGQLPLSFQVRIHSPLPPGVDRILNQATVNYDATGTGTNNAQTATDGDLSQPGNQTTTALVGIPQMAIADASVQATVSCGGAIDYVVTYSNVSGIAAKDVVITSVLDPKVQFLAASPAPDLGTANTWSVGTVLPGQSFSIRISTRMGIRLPYLYLVNHAVFLSSNGGTVQASARTLVQGCGP